MTSQSIEVVVPAPINVTVQEVATQVEVQSQPGVSVTVENGVTQQNLWVGPVKPMFSGPGIWIETGLGADGTGWTMWIEDGQ